MIFKTTLDIAAPQRNYSDNTINFMPAVPVQRLNADVRRSNPIQEKQASIERAAISSNQPCMTPAEAKAAIEGDLNNDWFVDQYNPNLDCAFEALQGDTDLAFNLANKAYGIAQERGYRYLPGSTGERAIIACPFIASVYAADILKAPFPKGSAGEVAVYSDAQAAYFYLKIRKDPYPVGSDVESLIAKSEYEENYLSYCKSYALHAGK